MRASAGPASTARSDTGFADAVAGAVRERLLELADCFHTQDRRLADVGAPDEVASLMLTVVPTPSPWDDAVGPFYLGDQVRRLLGGISRQALAERRSRRTLLALRTADDEWVYPVSQFDLEARRAPESLGAVLRAFETWDDDCWTIAGWLQRPLPDLDGHSVLGWLRSGHDPSPAVDAAREYATRLAR